MTMTDGRTGLARRGEALAARHLAGLGMEVLERNWRHGRAEADLVLRDGAALVICEVKTRRGLGYGDPLEAITVTKARRLRQLAGAYVSQADEGFGEVRVDAVGILWPDDGRPHLRHVRGVWS